MSRRQHRQQRRRRTDDNHRRIAHQHTRYASPRLVDHGSLGELVRGASWKGIDSVGELDPDQGYPG